MKNKRFPLFSASIAASFVLAYPAARAAITWDAGGVDTNWSTAANWNPDDADVTGDDVIFNATGAIASGTTNTVGADASINTLSYNFESANQHTTAIGAGQNLDVTGNVSVLTGTSPAAPTNVSFTGTGTLNLTGATVQLGNTSQTAAGFNSTTSVDMSALGTLTANLTGASSLFRVGGGGSGGNTTSNVVTLKLAADSTITAATVGVSDFSNFNTTQKMLLGSGTNTINSSALRVGNNSTGRSSGELSFNSGTGTLFLRGLDGVAAVPIMNMVNSTGGTTNNLKSVVNFAGHSVDAKITTLTMARRAGTTGGTASTFVSQSTLTFDQGTLDIGTANMGANANAALDGKIEATINIGGGTASFGAINMADNSTGNAVKSITAALNLTGGTTTVNGDIVKIGTTNSFANLPLNVVAPAISATLDMTGDDLTNLTSITYTDGLLKNLGIVNTGMTLAGTGSRVFDQGLNISGSIQGAITGTGVGLTKQGVGSLTLTGTNTYDGPTQVDDGALIYGSKNAKASGTTTTASAGSVGIGVHDSDALYYSAAEVGALFNTNSLTGFNLDPASGVLLDTTNAGGSFTQNVALTAARALTKNGTGTMILPGANAFTGNVTINGIANSNTLRIEHSESLGPIATAKNVTLTGANRQVSILELANNITVDINKTILTSGKSAIATGESALGSSVFLRSASGNNTWLGDIRINGAGGGYAIESAAGTLTLGAPATTSILRNDVLASTRAFNFLGAGDVVVNSRFVDTDLTTSTGLNKHGTGTLTLPRTDNQGTLATPAFAVGTTVVENMTDSGTQSSIGSGTSFNFGGTFRHAGAANSSSNRAFGLVGATPTLESSGTGTLALTSATLVAFVNGSVNSIAPFGAGDTIVTVRDAFSVFPGMTLAGTGIATGTKITAVNYDTRQITLDTPTSSAQALAVAGTISGTGDLDRTLTLGGTNTGGNLIASPIVNPSGTGKLALTKTGAGKWILSGANSYTGNTTISGGKLALGATNVLPDTSPVSIGSATLDAATAGTEDAGTLAVTGAATINLTLGAKIEFDDSNGTWSGTLNLTGTFVSGSSLKFANSTGLSAGQLSQISATGFTGFALDGSGFLTATPSGTPYTLWAATFLPGNDVSNPAGDNDGDGLVNQQEFAFGLSPISSSSFNPILVQLDKTSGTFTYQRRAGTGLTYRILTSTDLVSWPEDTTATLGQIATPSGSNQTVAVTLAGAPLAAPALFVRVAAE